MRRQSNMAAVVKYGQLQLMPLAGYGEPLPPSGCLLGSSSTLSFRWFNFRHLLANKTMQADREARSLQVSFGLTH